MTDAKIALKVLSGVLGAFLIVDDVLEHTVGSPITGRSKFDPTKVHHGYFGALLLWYALQREG
jgi:hypothetical protein